MARASVRRRGQLCSHFSFPLGTLLCRRLEAGCQMDHWRPARSARTDGPTVQDASPMGSLPELLVLAGPLERQQQHQQLLQLPRRCLPCSSKAAPAGIA